MESGGSIASEDFMRRFFSCCLLTMAILSIVTPVSHVHAEGPWRGQIVDAESGQPLAGVVILAFWVRSRASVGGWADVQYHDSEEIMTGPDGRFAIPSRRSYTIPLFTKVAGPEFKIFRSGYGEWQLRDPRKGEEFDKGVEAIIEMLRLKARQDRLIFLSGFGVPLVVPLERRRLLYEAINVERNTLGLGN